MIILGDLNKLIGNGEFGVKGNNPNVTPGGKLIHNLLKTEKYILVNASEECQGGPFTRFDPSDAERKSCLDLCIISKSLRKYLVEMIIDDRRLFTPHRAVQNGFKYSDHVSLHVKFKGIPEVMKGYQMDGKRVSWNTKKDSG